MQERGFISSLFDLSFESFVTVKLIRVLYVLALIGVLLSAVSILVGSLAQDRTFIGLIGAVVILCVGTLLARVYTEILMVVFRIADNTSIMAHAERDREGISRDPMASG